ncbi:MAG: GntR family transcriptional regulator [Comamonas sp.]|jgi:GntR family transcriptional regulator|uniref:GntR family transcriptional regulator n=1 Tax=Comamonas sp. TaxID=34028 RepID=UPI0028407985|nr:GntR family transcriptional regulator [Comamonas sp.]MDR3065965.1 GntR family transcriptional regulator [Comamonas sp.]
MTAAPTASQSRDKLHLQLARLFRNKITNGDWTLGQSIPTVEELEALHRVSRTTVRMAVHALVDEGLLETRKRGGTRVVGRPCKPPSFLLPTSWRELVAFGEQIRQTTLQQAHDCVPPIPAGFPCPGELAPAYAYFLRVHQHGEARFCLSELYLEQNLYPKLQEQLERATLAQALGNDPAQIAAARQYLSVAPADELIAAHLEVPLGTPLMQALRWARNPQGLVVYWAKVRFISEYVHMEMDLLK